MRRGDFLSQIRKYSKWQGFFCSLSLSRSHALSIISRRSDKIRISPSEVSGIFSETWPKRLHQITRKPKVFAEYASQPLDEKITNCTRFQTETTHGNLVDGGMRFVNLRFFDGEDSIEQICEASTLNALRLRTE